MGYLGKRTANALKICFVSFSMLLQFGRPSLATMPSLTPLPALKNEQSCRSWALQQDEDAIDMWGTQENGTASRDIAIDRLAQSCLGGPEPDIVGFWSSAGAADRYCKSHRGAKICDKLLSQDGAPALNSPNDSKNQTSNQKNEETKDKNEEGIYSNLFILFVYYDSAKLCSESSVSFNEKDVNNIKESIQAYISSENFDKEKMDKMWNAASSSINQYKSGFTNKDCIETFNWFRQNFPQIQIGEATPNPFK